MKHLLDIISKGCYDDTNAYGTDQALEKDVVSTYGELLPDSINEILTKLKIHQRDVIYDLGSGTGRVCLQIYLEKRARCVGIEYIKKRHDTAVKSLEELKAMKKNIRKLEFYQGNFLKHKWNDATVVYMCNLCFGDDLTKKILAKVKRECKSLRYIVCCKELSETFIEKVMEFNTPSSWDTKTTTYVYTMKRKA